MRFTGKVALVTGSSRNIGKAIARGFGREGANVIINARESKDELDETATEFRAEGIKVLPVLADVSDPRQVEDMVHRAIETFGKIDILMINHSVRPSVPFLKMTHEEWHWVMGVNLHSTLYLCQAVLPGMVERRSGDIIAIGGGGAGGGGGLGTPQRSHAAAAGAGRSALLRALMREFAPYGIRVNFVSPGIMDTVRKHPEWYPGQVGGPQNQPERLRQIPLGRPGKAEEVAAAVLFLASEEASYINGVTIGVNGGWGM